MEAEALEKRKKFASFYENLFVQNPELGNSIRDLEQFFDTHGILCFNYGGRMWNHIVHTHVSPTEIDKFSEVQKSAILKGNHDMLAVIPDKTADNPNYYNDMFTQVIPYINKIRDSFKNSVDLTKWKIDLDYDKIDSNRTITIGRSFRITLTTNDVKKRVRYAQIQDEDEQVTEKLLFYLEMGRNRDDQKDWCIDVNSARQVMVDDEHNLNVIGLIMMSQFLNVSRDKEKGVPIDSAREEILKEYLLAAAAKELTETDATDAAKAAESEARGGGKIRIRVRQKKYKYHTTVGKKTRNTIKTLRSKKSRSKKSSSKKSSSKKSSSKKSSSKKSETMVHEVYVNDPRNTLLYITLVLFPNIFNTEHFILYNNVRGIIMEKIFLLFDKHVKDGIEAFDSFLLDVQKDRETPSLRQILMLFITYLAAAFDNEPKLTDKYSLQMSGGDVFRLYLESITKTADIDTKLFYTTGAYVNIMQLAFFIVTFIAIYLHTNGYFRVDNHTVYTYAYGNIMFNRVINSRHQEIIFTSRVLPQFIVPLVSLDVKLNGYISCPHIYFHKTKFTDGYHVEPHNIAVVHTASPLDISLIRTKTVVQRTNCHPIDYFARMAANPRLTELALPNITDKYCIPPYPSLDYLIEDLDKIIKLNLRRNKKEKDQQRLAEIQRIRNNGGTYNMNRLFEIQQALYSSPMYKYLNTTVFTFIRDLVFEQKFLNKADINVYRNILTEYAAKFNVDSSLCMKVLENAQLYKKKPPTEYTMPHSFQEIYGEIPDDTRMEE